MRSDIDPIPYKGKPIECDDCDEWANWVMIDTKKNVCVGLWCGFCEVGI